MFQAGYLFGSSIQEGLSAAKSLGWLHESNFVFTKAFNLSKTILNHKEGILDLPLHVGFGWIAKPKWLQFIFQYGYTILLFVIKIEK